MGSRRRFPPHRSLRRCPPWLRSSSMASAGGCSPADWPRRRRARDCRPSSSPSPAPAAPARVPASPRASCWPANPPAPGRSAPPARSPRRASRSRGSRRPCGRAAWGPGGVGEWSSEVGSERSWSSGQLGRSKRVVAGDGNPDLLDLTDKIANVDLVYEEYGRLIAAKLSTRARQILLDGPKNQNRRPHTMHRIRRQEGGAAGRRPASRAPS